MFALHVTVMVYVPGGGTGNEMLAVDEVAPVAPESVPVYVPLLPLTTAVTVPAGATLPLDAVAVMFSVALYPYGINPVGEIVAASVADVGVIVITSAGELVEAA
jgi:hypothetical protein